MITITVLLTLPIFKIIVYYSIFLFESISNTKNEKQHIRGIMWNPGCEDWTLSRYEGQDIIWERNWVYDGIWSILIWLSWSGTVTNHPQRDN